MVLAIDAGGAGGVGGAFGAGDAGGAGHLVLVLVWDPGGADGVGCWWCFWWCVCPAFALLGSNPALMGIYKMTKSQRNLTLNFAIHYFSLFTEFYVFW